MSSEFLVRRYREFENLSPNEILKIDDEHRDFKKRFPGKLTNIEDTLVWISHVYRCFPCAIENDEKLEKRYGNYFA